MKFTTYEKSGAKPGQWRWMHDSRLESESRYPPTVVLVQRWHADIPGLLFGLAICVPSVDSDIVYKELQSKEQK